MLLEGTMHLIVIIIIILLSCLKLNYLTFESAQIHPCRTDNSFYAWVSVLILRFKYFSNSIRVLLAMKTTGICHIQISVLMKFTAT